MNSLDQIVEKFGAHVETLFKVEGPFQAVDQGFMGVFLRNGEDQVHCHLCGKWLRMLGPHLWRTHKIKTDAYRKKYGLPLEFPLCGRSVSAGRSERSLDPTHLERLRKLGKKYRLKGKKLRRKIRLAMKYAKNNAAHENKHGACEQQILRRFLLVCDRIGKSAGQNDLEAHDNALRGIIYRRYGSLNAFKDKHGLEKIERAPISSDEELLSAIIKFYDENNRVPMASDFNGKAKAIRHRFGSWHRALSIAGFSPEPAALRSFLVQ